MRVVNGEIEKNKLPPHTDESRHPPGHLRFCGLVPSCEYNGGLLSLSGPCPGGEPDRIALCYYSKE